MRSCPASFVLLSILSLALCVVEPAHAQTDPYLRLSDPRSIAKLRDPFRHQLQGFAHFNLTDDFDPRDHYHLLASYTGKGVLSHLSFVNDAPDSSVWIKIWIDDTLVAAGRLMDLRTTGQGLVRPPLFYWSSGATISDLQLPFHRNFRITYDQTIDDKIWYSVFWRTVDDTVDLPSVFSPTYAAMQARAEAEISTADIWPEKSDSVLAADHQMGMFDTIVIASIDGPGVLHEIAVKPQLVDPLSLDSLKLLVYWDDHDVPDISASVGDLFGALSWPRRNPSIVMKTDDQATMALRFPMPFEHHATIKIVNHRDWGYGVSASVRFAHEPVDHRSDCYFFADVQRTNPTRYHVWHPVLHTQGVGTFVGMMLQFPSLSAPVAMEGDPWFRADSSSQYSFRLTGTEDYFNGGNYFASGIDPGPFGGCLVWLPAMCRFNWFDAMTFDRSFDFDLEHGSHNDVKEDYRTVAFYYKQWTPFRCSRDTVRAGEQWRVEGKGYASRESVLIGLGGVQLGSVSADDKGRFVWDGVIPAGVRTGPQYLSVNGEQKPEPIYVLERPTIRPIIDTLPLTLEVGDSLQITVSGFADGESFRILLGDTPIKADWITATGSDHRGYARFFVPVLPEGIYPLRAVGNSGETAYCPIDVRVTTIRNYEFELLLPPVAASTDQFRPEVISYFWWTSWSQQAIADFRPKALGDSITFGFWVPQRDTFAVYAFATLGVEFGNYSYALDGSVGGSFNGYIKTWQDRAIPTDTLHFPLMVLDSGTHTFTYHYQGRDPRSVDSLLGADHFVLVPLADLRAIVAASTPSSKSDPASLAPLIVYPNPSSGELRMRLPRSNALEGARGELTVVAINGSEILRRSYVRSTEADQEVTVHLPPVASGEYLLRFKWDGDATPSQTTLRLIRH